MPLKLKKDINYSYLFFGLLLVLLAMPLVVETRLLSSAPLVQFVFCAMLIVSVWSLSDVVYVTIIGWGLAAMALFITTASMFTSAPPVIYLNFVLLAFYVFTVWLALSDVLGGGEINRNRIVGAICVYLLLGVLWGQVYIITHHYLPDAFSGIGSINKGAMFFECTYFSFVTLTTLGFGDIAPQRPISQALVILEACSGVMYLSVLIGRLIGEHLKVNGTSAE